MLLGTNLTPFWVNLAWRGNGGLISLVWENGCGINYSELSFKMHQEINSLNFHHNSALVFCNSRSSVVLWISHCAPVRVQLCSVHLSLFVLLVPIVSFIMCKLKSKASLYHGIGRESEMWEISCRLCREFSLEASSLVFGDCFFLSLFIFSEAIRVSCRAVGLT